MIIGANREESLCMRFSGAGTGKALHLCNTSGSPHNILNLTLRIHSQPETDEGDVTWCLDNTDDLSPSSSLSPPSQRVQSDDSGFSSDDNAQLLLMQCKLSRSKSSRSALRSPALSRSESNKSVRFADALGLDLVHKNYYETDDGTEWRLSNDDLTVSSTREIRNQQLANTTLSLDDIPKRAMEEISHLTRTQCVCLRSASVIGTNFMGVIDVMNLSCDKQVFVRYTTDSWQTHAETPAVFSNVASTDGAVEAFKFFVALPADLAIGVTCCFCIRYAVNNSNFWDNNLGSNYQLHAIFMPSEQVQEDSTTAVASRPQRKLGRTEHSKEDSSNCDEEEEDCSSIPFSQRSAIRQRWKRHQRHQRGL